VSGSGKRAGRKTSTALRPDSTGELRRRIDKRKSIVEVYLYLAAALTVIHRLINRARTIYRWLTRPLAPPSVIPWARPGRFLPPFC
jgi:hypothetical protein